jgi:hypothetical protein
MKKMKLRMKCQLTVNLIHGSYRYHKQCGASIGGTDSYVAGQWPTCATHFTTVFGLPHNALGELVPFVSYVAHAGVHLMIGGAAGSCDEWSSALAKKVRALER